MHLQKVNLLEHFYLQHVQVSHLKAKLINSARSEGKREAKVELNLAPRLLKADSGDELPAYQVSAKLSCRGGGDDIGPHFEALAGIEAIYQQLDGEPLDVAEFSSHHASLTRQLYPLLQQEMRILLLRLGLEQIRLPYDLPARVEHSEEQAVQISGSVH